MRMRKLIVAICLVGVFSLGNSGCERSTSATEQRITERNQKVLLANQPPVSLEWSLERKNINRRTTLWNDANKVSYIYLVSFGKVMAFYSIKGKVSSVNSQITNPMQRGYNGNPMPSPAEDGSYGTNGDGVFFFTTDGTYVEWAGEYMLADKPLKLSTPPALVRTIE